MSAIPTSTSVSESAVIPAPLSKVWHLIKLGDFSKWWSALEASSEVKSGILNVSAGTSPEADIYKWKFKDGTEFQVKQEEHSTINHYITYSVITSDPAITYTSVLSTIRLWEVTTGTSQGHTFVTWTANFSNDADAGVIEDARFKRKEALADLAKAVHESK